VKHFDNFKLNCSTFSLVEHAGPTASFNNTSKAWVAPVIISVFSEIQSWVMVAKIFGKAAQHVAMSTLQKYMLETLD
jgi:hypothetical protein